MRAFHKVARNLRFSINCDRLTREEKDGKEEKEVRVKRSHRVAALKNDFKVPLTFFQPPFVLSSRTNGAGCILLNRF